MVYCSPREDRIMKKIVAIIVLLAIVIAGYIAAGPSSPYMESSQGLSIKIRKRSLRTSILSTPHESEGTVQCSLYEQFISDWKDNPFAALGTSFSSKLVEDRLIHS